jgi:hypothetical protein
MVMIDDSPKTPNKIPNQIFGNGIYWPSKENQSLFLLDDFMFIKFKGCKPSALKAQIVSSHVKVRQTHQMGGLLR